MTMHFKEFDLVQHECGYSLLRKVAGKTTMHYEFRDALAGPDSELLIHCPECHKVIKGIDDIREGKGTVGE